MNDQHQPNTPPETTPATETPAPDARLGLSVKRVRTHVRGGRDGLTSDFSGSALSSVRNW